MRALFHTIVWLLELAVGLAFILLVLVAILPWLLSINGTRAVLLSLAGTASDRQIAVEEASFNWFGPQFVKGLCVQDSAKHASLQCDEIATDASLWQILVGSHDIDNLRIVSPYLLVQTEQSIPQMESTASILQSGLSLPFVKPHVSPLASLTQLCAHEALAKRFTGQINLMGGTVEIAGPHIDSVFFRSITAMANQKAGEALIFHVQGDTAQKSEKGEIQGNFHIDGTLSPCNGREPVLALQGAVSRLPVLGLDQLVSLARPEMRGMLVAALGTTLDLTVSAAFEKETGDLTFDLTTPQAKASIAMTTQNGKISLRAPASGSITVTRMLADTLLAPIPFVGKMGHSPSSQLLLNIESMAIPVSEKGIEWQDLSAKATMRLTNLKLSTPAMTRTIDLSELQATAKTDKLQRDLVIDANMKFLYADTPCNVASTMQIVSPLQSSSLETITLSVDRFPVAFFDHLLLKNGQFENALGATLDIRFGLDKSEEGPVAVLYLASPQVSIDGATWAVKPHFQLKKPFNILLKPSEAWMQNCLPDVAVAPIDIAVKDFSMGDSLSTIAAHIEAKAESVSIENYLLQHPVLSLNIRGWEAIALAFQAEGLSTAFDLSYDPQQHLLSTKEPSRLVANLDPAAWAAFSSHMGKPMQLLKAASATLEVLPFSLSLQQGAFEKLSLSGTFDLPHLALARANKPGSRMALQDVSFRWRMDKEKGECAVRGGGQVTGSTDAWSSFQFESLARNIPSGPNATPTPADIICKFTADALDTTALDLWSDISHSLAPLLGSPLSIKSEIMQRPASKSFILNAKSDRLQLECGIAQAEDKLVLRNSRQPIVVNWTVFPEGFAAGADIWKKVYGEEIPFSLAKPCPVSMRVDALSIPLQAGVSLPETLAQTLASGSLSIERLPLLETATQEPLTFQHILLQMQRASLKSPLQFSLQTAVEAVKPGLAEIKGTIQQTDSLRMKMEANFQNIPTLLPDVAATLAGLKPHTLATIFGPMLTGSLRTDIEASSGPLNVQINTPSTRLSLNGTLNKGVLALNEPLIAQVTMTEDFSRRLLEQTNPLSVDIVTSEGPMTLTVDKEGFAFPLFPYNLTAAVVSHARIDLGKITCHNKGNLTDMLTLLKQGQFSREKDLKLWFAPLDISMKGGIIECERTEILVANRFDIATWGKVDLNKNRVKAVLGLTAQTLESAYGLKDLPPDYILQLPMKGTIGDVKIDTKKATAKIALLLAWQKSTSPSSGGFLGGSKGAIVGGLLGKLSQLPDYGESVPPAKHPFPWENEQSQGSRPKKRKTAIKPGDKPLKQLIKLFRQ